MSSNKLGESSTLDFQSPLECALYFYNAGLRVIPIVSDTKRPAVKWDPWLESICKEAINDYWDRHPEHGVGFIVPEGLVVFDADSPSSVAALHQIEQSFDLTCRFIVKTKRGEHHYFRLSPSTKIKTCSMDTAKFPHGIDVKARRSMVLLPFVNSGKSIEVCEIDHKKYLSVIGQDVVDAVFGQNGKIAPSSPVLPRPPRTHNSSPTTTGKQLTALLEVLDPDMGYDDWIHVGMALSHETKNSDEGYEIFDAWSSKGAKYNGG